MLSSGGEWKDCGGSRDLSLLLVMKLFIRKNQKVIPSGAARASYKTYERRRKKVPFTKPMTSHQLPSSEDPGIPLSLPIESSSLLPVTPAPSDSNIDLPIALRKGKGSCTIHPITQFLSFEGLSPSYRCSCSFFCKRTQKQVYGRPLLILNGEGLWLKRRRH